MFGPIQIQVDNIESADPRRKFIGLLSGGSLRVPSRALSAGSKQERTGDSDRCEKVAHHLHGRDDQILG
jgi:hypothetical protein